MAKKTVVTQELVDDLDGSTGDRTVSFTWDGRAYEIELSRKNAAAFTRAMKPYVDAGRRVRNQRLRRGRGSGAGRRDLSDIRDWAAANGYKVAPRGRIASDVVEAYDAANS